ncbi:MAG: sodium:proton antiporter [Alistipes sp.]|nr:sodium:proton antiporter [Alistipes sp.]
MHQVELWMVIPFVIMLLTIAIAPLAMEHVWESNRNKFIFTFAISVVTIVLLSFYGMGHSIVHNLLYDYIPFIMLLLALFVVTGGIHIRGDIAATPFINTSILGMGFLLASFMGTTGAAMLLIRPLLQINKQRKYRVHTVLFFIALVANCGGILTPLGDPPLFLLYLRGAEFQWFSSMFPEWLVAGLLLMCIYFILDRHYYAKEPAENILRDSTEHEPIRISGARNFIYLGMVIAAVLFLNRSYIPAMRAEGAPFYIAFLRDIVLGVIIILSLVTTPKQVRKANNFSWAPILEVAILFVGIFVTMTPAMMYLNQHAMDLGLTEPWQFFYSTGTLSSFLDNAPTAVAFHTVATGLPEVAGVEYVAGIPEILLTAISLGAVFFGAMTYIGNGPNFMVKAIAEEAGVKMPSFFGYIVKFSLVILLPVYVIVQLIFLPF